MNPLHAKLLIVGGDRALRQALRALVQELGVIHVDEANDGRDALARHAQRGYHLIIAEWNCAPLNGINLVRAIRNAGQAQTSLLLLTSDRVVERTVEALQSGANALVALPVDPRRFGEKLKRMVASLPAQVNRADARRADVWSPETAA